MKEDIAKIIKGNERFADKKGNAAFEAVAAKQTPKITLVMCSDSRIPAECFGVETFNYIFAVENAGNRLDNDFPLASVSYSIDHNKTPILFILGHTGCGAIAGAFGNHANERSHLKNYLDDFNANLSKVLREIENEKLDDSKKYAAISEANVDLQVDFALKEYRNKVDSGSLTIIGGVFDLHGMYSQKKGRVFITNLNGERDVSKIKIHPVMSEIQNDIKYDGIKRLI